MQTMKFRRLLGGMVFLENIYVMALHILYKTTRIGVFACGQILCISPNGLQASRGIN